MYSLIFAGVFFFFALIAALIGLLKGRKYDWRFSLSKLIIVVVSVVLTIVLLVLLAPLAGELVYDLVGGFLPAEVSDLLAAIPSARSVVSALVAMILAPLCFIGLFAIIRGLLSLTKRPLCRLIMLIGKKKPVENNENAESVESVVAQSDETDETAEATESEDSETVTVELVSADESSEETEEKKKPKKKKRNSEFLSTRKFDPAGAICGALCSFLVYVVFLMPFIGFIDVANTVTQPILPADTSMVSEIVDAAANNAGSKTVKFLGGKLMFNTLTTYSVNDEKATLEDEIGFVATVIEAVDDISNEKLANEDKVASLKVANEAFDNSTIVPILLSEVLSSASDDWSKGEEFCGIACPSIGEEFDPIVQDLVGAMKDSTTTTVKEDVATIVDVVVVLVENDGLDTLKDDDGALSLFRNEKVTSGIMLELLENKRLSCMVESFTNLGISLFTSSLDISSNYDEMYNGFISEMSAAYMNAASGAQGKATAVRELSKDIKDIYTGYGIEVSESVATCVAADMLEGVSRGTTGEIKSFFANEMSSESLDNGECAFTPMYLAASDTQNGKIFTTVNNIKNATNSNTTEEQFEAIVKAELANTLKGLSAEELDALAKEVADNMYDDISEDNIKLDKLVFTNAQEMHKSSVRVAAIDLKLSGSNVKDKQNEAKMIAHAFSVALEMMDKISADGNDIEKIINDIGVVLDAFSDCETVGNEKTALLLKAILQSDTVCSQVGFTMLQATDIADSIPDGVDGDENYTTLLKSVGHTVKIIKASSNNEDTTEAVTELIKDITPASSKVLQNLSTPETIKNYGVQEESAKPVSNMLSSMFDNMATAKDEGMSDEEYEKESVSVNDMLTLAMTASESDKETTFGEDGAMGITITEFVDRATDSKIMSQTFVQTVYEDGDNAKTNPLNSTAELNDAEKAELQDALGAKWQEQLTSSNDAEANEECKKTLTAIAVMVNADITFTDAGVVIG